MNSKRTMINKDFAATHVLISSHGSDIWPCAWFVARSSRFRGVGGRASTQARPFFVPSGVTSITARIMD